MRTKKTSYDLLFMAIGGFFLYLVLTYHDTEGFQSGMNFLFNPDSNMALPQIWQDNRMLIWGCLFAGLLFHYKPVWLTYRTLITTYNDSHIRAKKPPLTVLQASYMYRQDQALSMVTWLINLCSQGVLFLHFKKGARPWSISQTKHAAKNPTDQEMVDILFQHKKQIDLQTILHDPEPDVKDVSEQLIQDLRMKNSHFFHPHKSCLPALILLIALIAEIPFYVASLNEFRPSTIIITIFSAITAAGPAYVFCTELSGFFSDSKMIAWIKFAVSLIFILIAHSLLFTGHSAAAPYWSTALYPDLTAALIVFIYKAPLLPENNSFFSHLIGYQKYLSQPDYQIREKDLPWTLGLNTHADLFGSSFSYKEKDIPDWLQGDGTDNNTIMKTLHQTFYHNVSEAIYGEMHSKNHLGAGASNMSREF